MCDSYQSTHSIENDINTIKLTAMKQHPDVFDNVMAKYRQSTQNLIQKLMMPNKPR